MKEQAVRQAKDLLITVLILTAATGIGNIFWYFSFTRNIISVYILGTLLTSLFAKSYFYGFLSSFSSVLLFNFCFTEPRLTLHAYERGYPVTFAIMLIVSIITVTLAIQNIRNAEEKERAAVRAKNEQLRADLLRTISHDLRTPLTSISGNASNLISNYEKMDDPTRKQTFLDIYDDSMWLINLVENILSISRIEDGRMNLSISTELVSEVFEEALRHTNRHSGQHTITVQMDDDLLLAHMDAKLVVQVLINLVDNAIKYTPAGSHIVLSAAAQGESAVIRVSDDGPGIPDSLGSTVGNPVFPTKQKKRSLKCSPPGKNAFRTAAAALGWDWPYAARSSQPTAAPLHCPTIRRTAASLLLHCPLGRFLCMNKPLILVVEDDAPIRNLITTTLKTQDYKYIAAATASEALQQATIHAPDVMLLDLGLPDLDGIEVIRRIRSWSAMPIIVISARSEDSDKIEALDSGADDYLTKPFSVEELLARLRVTFRRISMLQNAAGCSVFTNGDLQIDFAAGCATLKGQELHLTPIEYRLLCVMAKNCGKVLTHTYITHEVWGSSWDNDVASLRVFMATLRKKLEFEPDSPQYIQTHIGIGYRMLKV